MRTFRILLCTAAMLAVLSFATAFWGWPASATARCHAIQVEGTELVRLAAEASRGNAAAFDRLKAARDSIDGALLQCDGRSSPAWAERVMSSWQPMRSGADAILAKRNEILQAQVIVARIEAQLPPLQRQFEQMSRRAVEVSAPGSHVYMLERQSMLFSRLPHLLHQITGEETGLSLDGGMWALSRSVYWYRRVFEGLAEGSAEMDLAPMTDAVLAALLQKSIADFAVIETAVTELEPISHDLYLAQEAASGIATNAMAFVDALARAD